MTIRLLALTLSFLFAGAVGSRAQTLPEVEDPGPPYYVAQFAVGTKPEELKMPVTYTLWMPEGVKKIRGIIVHQHGCGIPAGKTGLTAAYDLHWQALAKKWDCALLGPSYHQLTEKDCRQWCDPRNGSNLAFLKALEHFAKVTGHAELTTVPWGLWGHSGGGFWSSLMLTLHPERIAAIWFRSGSAFAVWQRGEIPAPSLTPAVYEVPMMFNGGVKEENDKRHGPARVGDRAMLKWWRDQGAPAGSAPDPLTGHECGDSRYLAIPFFDACLAQRLPAKDDVSGRLRPVNWTTAWYSVPGSGEAASAPNFSGDKATAHWLPDAAFATRWTSHVKTGRPSDTTPPPAPVRVTVSPDQTLAWTTEVDFESGLAGFIILRDGKEIARLPEKPLSKYGTPLFQGMTHGDTPMVSRPSMRYQDTTAVPGAKHVYQVMGVNAAGLKSEPAPAVPTP